MAEADARDDVLSLAIHAAETYLECYRLAKSETIRKLILARYDSLVEEAESIKTNPYWRSGKHAPALDDSSGPLELSKFTSISRIGATNLHDAFQQTTAVTLIDNSPRLTNSASKLL